MLLVLKAVLTCMQLMGVSLRPPVAVLELFLILSLEAFAFEELFVFDYVIRVNSNNIELNTNFNLLDVSLYISLTWDLKLFWGFVLFQRGIF